VAPAHHRLAYVGAPAGLVDVPVHAWEDLRPGGELAGPALFDGPDSTAYIAPGFTCRVGPMRVLHLTTQ
jgi:N-methylhydantoinase A/oxoprolinase/acetone carboxylase beta subunit